MAQYDGSIRINTSIDTKNMKKGFSEVKGSVKDLGSSIDRGLSALNGHINGIGAKFKSMGTTIRREASGINRSIDGLSGSFKRLGAAVASAFAVRRVAGFASHMTELGSDLEEVQNVVDVTFTTMSDKIDEFAKSAAKSAGLSETMAKRYVGTFGAMSKSFGFAEKEAYSMSTALTQLAGDVASFYNISQDEAYTKLKSVFTGETETLKDLGVVMTENALNSYAMAKGIGKSVSKMTEQQKVALRYQFVLDKLSGATGDFVRTQDSWANQTRVLKLQIESLKATIGQGLINAFTPVLKMLNTLLAKLKTAANAFKSFTESFFGKSSSGSTGGGLKDYSDATGELAGSLEDVSDSAEDAKKSLEGYLSPLDEINKYTTGKDNDLLSGIEDIDFGKFDDLGMKVEITPEIDESGISDKFRQFAEKTKSILQSLFDPLKESWDREGQFVMDSWKFALDSTWGLIKDIGRDFLEVWQQKATIKIFENILHIIGDIGLVIGILAEKFREAWNENEVGLHILENIRDIIGIIIEHIKSMADATVEWAEKLDFYPLLDAFNGFLESLEPVVDAISGILEDFYTKVLLPLGQWVLEEGLPKLLQVFIDFNNKVDWGALRSNLAEFWEHLEPFAETVGEGLIIFIGSLSEALANFINSPALSEFLEMIENWMDSVTPEDVADAFQKIATAIVALKVAIVAFPVISGAFAALSTVAGILKGALSLLSPIISLITLLISGITSALGALASPIGIAIAAIALLAAGFVYLYNTNEDFKNSIDTLYSEHIKPFFDSISNSVSEMKDKFVEFWEGRLKPMLEEWGEKIWELWEDHIQPALGNIFDLLTKLWDEILKPIIMWLFDVFAPMVADVCDIVFNVIDTAVSLIADVINGIVDVIEGVIDILLGIATGDWQRVWDGFAEVIDGVAGVIKGIINGIIGVVEGVANAVVAAVNTMIRAINSISFTVPDWVPGVGGESVGFNIPEISKVSIPALARGAVIPPNKEFIALLGDQKHGTNIEAPIDTIKQAQKESLIEVLSQLGLTGGNTGKGNVYNVKATANRRVLFELMIEEGKVQQMSSGENPFLLGTT